MWYVGTFEYQGKFLRRWVSSRLLKTLFGGTFTLQKHNFHIFQATDGSLEKTMDEKRPSSSKKLYEFGYFMKAI